MTMFNLLVAYFIFMMFCYIVIKEKDNFFIIVTSIIGVCFSFVWVCIKVIDALVKVDLPM